jgi:hypothetical protein
MVMCVGVGSHIYDVDAVHGSGTCVQFICGSRHSPSKPSPTTYGLAEREKLVVAERLGETITLL